MSGKPDVFRAEKPVFRDEKHGLYASCGLAPSLFLKIGDPSNPPNTFALDASTRLSSSHQSSDCHFFEQREAFPVIAESRGASYVSLRSEGFVVVVYRVQDPTHDFPPPRFGDT